MDTRQTGGARAIRDIRRTTRKQYSVEEKIRIMLDGLRGEESIAEQCRREGIAQRVSISNVRKSLLRLANLGLPVIRFGLPLLER